MIADTTCAAASVNHSRKDWDEVDFMRWISEREEMVMMVDFNEHTITNTLNTCFRRTASLA